MEQERAALVHDERKPAGLQQPTIEAIRMQRDKALEADGTGDADCWRNRQGSIR